MDVRKQVVSSVFFTLFIGAAGSVCAQDWADDVGGIFNIPPVQYNPIFHGYGSSGQTIYNKIDLQDGRVMEIGNVPMYDNQGNQIATALASGVGYYDGFRDGGIIAGAITRIRIGRRKRSVIYVWSVNVEGGGRDSGWVRVTELSPRDDIIAILELNKDVRMSLIQDDIDDGDYEAHTVQATYLPSWAEEYYLVPNRSSSYTAGKAKYYYTRDDLISGLKNIPETGSQRYGVAHDKIPLGATFYRDMNVDRVNVPIYPPSSSSRINHQLRLVWGYCLTSAGQKWYSWINERALD